MITLATALWDNPNSHTKGADGVSLHYVWKCFVQLLLKSLLPDFKVIIQTKLDPALLMDGPLICLTIARSVFVSGTILKRELRNSMIKLSIPGSNDNYGKYLQSLRSSLIMSPDEQDPQV
jgi:hypothetical protein